jgi:hypothetical protein
MARDLFIDTTNRRLATSLTSLVPATTQRFVKGDNGAINLYFLEATNNVAAPFNVIDYTGTDVKFGVGSRTGTPASGTFTLSFGGQTSGAIAFSATAGAISSALNSLSTITAAGSVSVDGTMATNFVVSFNSAGTQSAITGNFARLIPTTTALIDERLVGDATNAEIQEIQLRLAPAVYEPTWTDLGTAMTVSVATTLTGSTLNNEIQRVTFSRAPYLGSYRFTVPTYNVDIASTVTDGVFITTSNHGLTLAQPVVLTGFTALTGYTAGLQYFVRAIPQTTEFLLGVTAGAVAITTGTGTVTTGSVATTVLRQTTPLDASTTAAELQAALEALDSIGTNNVTVVGVQNSYYDINFSGEKSFTDLPTLQVQSGLSAAPGKTAAVDFNTFGVRDLLLNATSVTTELEIELTTAGERSTIILQPCTLTEELISQGGLS